MPPFSGKKKKEQLKARRQRKREESEEARVRDKARDEALLAGADPDELAEVEAAAAAALPRGRHAKRRQKQDAKNKASRGLGSDEDDSGSDDNADDDDQRHQRDGDYDPKNEFKYGADRKGVRSVFQKESQAELAARRALSYQPLTQRTFITSSGVPYGSWFVLAGNEAVMTAAKKKKAQREAEKAARAAKAAQSNSGSGDDDADANDRARRRSPAVTPAPPPDLVAYFGASAVSTTFPFSVELPSRGWWLNAETGALEPTYTAPSHNEDSAGAVKSETAKASKSKQVESSESSHQDSSSSAESNDDDEEAGEEAETDEDVGEGEVGAGSPDTAQHATPFSAADNEAIDAAERRCFHDYLHALDHYTLPDELADLQVNSYERNLEVWRQLWRTVEVSDVVIIVTDARFPIIHTPAALLRYITIEQQKPCVVVLNKSDLVPANVLQSWVVFLTQLFARLGLRVESEETVRAAGSRSAVGGAGDHDQDAASADSANAAAPIVIIPFTADPRGGQSAIEGITERVDVSKRLRKKEKRRAKMYEQLRTGRAQYNLSGSDDDDDGHDHDDDLSYHSDVNFKGMRKAEHSMQQEKREYKELQVVADAITSMMALCRSLVPQARISLARTAAEESVHTGRVTGAAAGASAGGEDDEEEETAAAMRTSHLPSAPPLKHKANRKKKKSKRRQLLPHGGVAPPSESDDDDDESDGERGGGDGHGANADDDVLHDRAPDKDAYVHVGFVGFPNVGKSSLLNCIRGTKVVSVSATPGHTKHIQTIPIPSEGITLVDSPGLAFPCFGVPRPLQAIIGTHQIAQTRDPQSSVAYLASYLPIETIYGLHKPDGAVEEEPWTPYDICEAYAKKRGFFVKHGKGALDIHRGAIALLQEAYEGRLAFFFAPPELNLLSAKYFEATVLPLLYLPVLHGR